MAAGMEQRVMSGWIMVRLHGVKQQSIKGCVCGAGGLTV